MAELNAFVVFTASLVSPATRAALLIIVGSQLCQPADADSTEQVSLSSSGAQANGHSFMYEPIEISADGRFVAFQSYATNLVSGDTNEVGDIFLRDRLAGTTKRVSVASSGIQGNGQSYGPSISADGRFVAFTSDATNLVAGGNVTGVFVHDRATATTELVEENSDSPSISADGRFVAFAGKTVPCCQAFVHDRTTHSTENISVRYDRHFGDGYDPSISADGRFVAFCSSDPLIANDTNGAYDTYVRDRLTDRTERVSIDSSEKQTGGGGCGAISASGRFVAFTSSANDLVARDTNGSDDIFVRDRLKGTTTRVSVRSGGAESNELNRYATISADGRFVGFMSESTNLVPGDTNNEPDMFMHDRLTRTTKRISVGSAGQQSNGISY